VGGVRKIDSEPGFNPKNKTPNPDSKPVSLQILDYGSAIDMLLVHPI